MSEKAHHLIETEQKSQEQENRHKEHLANLEKQAAVSRHEHADHIEHIRSSIEHESNKTEAHKESQPIHENQPSHHYITKKIKAEQYQKTLKHIQVMLPKRQQKFSVFIHQPAVERASEVGAKTLARPSGIIGGALLALMGSLTVILIARRIGFEVPNSIFAVLFIIGFALGIIIELSINLFKKLQPKIRRKAT